MIERAALPIALGRRLSLRAVLPARLPPVRDSHLVAAAAGVVSTLAWFYFHQSGGILAYQDAISHMEIARRVVDSPTTGFGQLGGVWLPLPHLLMLPFIWSNGLYYSGLAGSLVSMGSFVAASVLLYKIVLDLTDGRVAALVGSLVFVLNPGVLYLQSTPMTELLMFACMLGTVYGVQRWLRTDDFRYLLGAGAAAFFGTLTRYEVWVLLLTTVTLLILVGWRKRYGRVKVEGVALAFMFFGAAGILGWLGWNQVIFGNALNWQDGQYAKPSLWVGSGDKAVGHWLTAIETYWYAVVDDLGLPVVCILIAGLVVLLLARRQVTPMLPALSLLVMFPFFVLALESGQRPLHVLQLDSDLYNVRFGLLMILPAAIFAGCLAGLPQRRWVVAAVTAGIVAIAGWQSAWGLLHPKTKIAVLQEPVRWQRTGARAQDHAAFFLHRRYTGGKILAQFFSNEDLLFRARIALRANIYEGSYRQWLPALAQPSAHGIRWIVMHVGDPTDKVTSALTNSPELRAYKLVYRNREYRIYEGL